MLSQSTLSLIGKVGKRVVLEVENGAIRRYADAVGDRNPLYWDEDYAHRSKHPSLVAPFGFFGWPTTWDGALPFFSDLREEIRAALANEGYTRVLDGGIEHEYLHPVHAGDKLIAEPRIAEISERETKSGKMVLYITETTYTDEHGHVMARERKANLQR